jgi:hypothetical protein
MTSKKMYLTGYQAWWHMLVILALRRRTQEDLKFKASLGYRVGYCLKKTFNGWEV